VVIDLELFGQLLPGQPRRRDFKIQGPATVRDIARAIGLDPSEIGMVAIDGVQSELDDVVSPDSRLCFFPYVSGG
jgi:hypothetical protein